MCKEFFITSMVAGVVHEETRIDECPEKPPSGIIKDCPNYKFIPSGSSRKKQTLPAWANNGTSSSQ
jgi:hypothetical protein